MIDKHTKKVGELTKAEDYVKKQFYKLFKEKTGDTPNQFRKAHPLL